MLICILKEYILVRWLLKTQLFKNRLVLYLFLFGSNIDFRRSRGQQARHMYHIGSTSDQFSFSLLHYLFLTEPRETKKGDKTFLLFSSTNRDSIPPSPCELTR